jgi:hypothetical protein
MQTFAHPAALVVVLAVLVGTGLGQAQEKKPAQPKKPTVMQRKLIHAQRVLEGLALNDFDKITKGADELILCTQEASWKVTDAPRYALYSNDFLRNLEAMKKAAKAKNVDAAALSYVDMTLTCVKCHQYVREEKIGAAPDLSPLTPKAVKVR